MKIIIAPDSFKESVTASQAAKAIATGWESVLPHDELLLLPVADGGEGTTEALVTATQGQLFTQRVTNPLGQLVDAQWGLLGDGETAVIETAAASGLHLVPLPQRNPLLTTSRGTGELILAALDHGVKRIIVGLGGSATNDAGAGLLQALGVRLLDKEGNTIADGGGGLAALAHIDLSQLEPRLATVSFEVACDVNNPLLGEKGASAVFAPQKGATPMMVAQLDANLRHFAQLAEQVTGRALHNIAGAGAAGGLGAAFLGFLPAKLKSGIDIVLDAMHFEQQLVNADLVITGEGRIDQQTVYGKTPIGVARRAKNHQVPVIALTGSITSDAVMVHEQGIDALFSIVTGVCDLETALAQGEANLTLTARNIAVLWQLGRNSKMVSLS